MLVMALTDLCLLFSSIVWFLAAFVRSLILINALDNANFLFMFINLIFLKWVQKWGKVLSELLKNLYIFFSLCLSIVLLISCTVFYEVSLNNCCFLYVKLIGWIDLEVLNINWRFFFGSLTITMCFIVDSCILFLLHYLLNVRLMELSLIPDFFLTFTAVAVIIHCCMVAYNKKYNTVLLQFSVTSLCMLIVFLTLLLYFHEGLMILKHFPFEFSSLNDLLQFLPKLITIIASLFCVYLLQDYIIEYKISSTEYDLLMLHSILGLTMLIIDNDFGTIFLSLELQSLSLYILSGLKKNSIYSIENGLKYFILGAFSTACFLLGWSLLYVISGLFVLLGFYFFFSDFNKIVEKSLVPYETTNENQYNNNEFEAIESSIISCEDLVIDIINESDEIGILSLFNNHFNVVLKLAEFLCFNSNDDNINEVLNISKRFLRYFKLWCRRKIELFLLLKKHTELVKECLTKIIPFLHELKKVHPTIVTDELILDCLISIDFVSEYAFGFKLYTDTDTRSIGISKHYSNTIRFKSSRIKIIYWKRESLLKNVRINYINLLGLLHTVLITDVADLPPTPENILLKEKLLAILFILNYLFQFVICFSDTEAQQFLFLFDMLLYYHSNQEPGVRFDGLSSEIFFKNLKVLTKTL